MNVPNILTFIRIASVPIFMVVFFLPFPWAHKTAALIYAAGAITDWLDGYLARRLGQTSRLGAFLDPVADKLAVAVGLILLVQANPTVWFAMPAAIIIGREIIISALREWMAGIGSSEKVAVSALGKVKTLSQMFALGFILYRDPLFHVPVFEIGFVLLYLAAGLTLWSMWRYLLDAWPVLSREDK